MFNKNIIPDFCPKCGALMRGEVCQSCGYVFGQESQNIGLSNVEQPINQPNEQANESFNSVKAEQLVNQSNPQKNGVQGQPTGGVYSSNYQAAMDSQSANEKQQSNTYIPNISQNQQWNGHYDQDINQNQPGQHPFYEQAFNPANMQMPSKKKNNTALIVVIIIAVLAVLAGLAVYACYLMFKTVDSQTEAGAFQEALNDIYGDYAYDENDPFMQDGYESSFGADHTNKAANEVGDEYYTNLCDCIDFNVDYTMRRDYYEYTSDKATIQVAYVQLEGDSIPNLDEINQEIEDTSKYLANYYLDEYEDDESGYDGTYAATVDSYISYNDSDMISIVLDENWDINGEGGLDLYAMNINLENGMMLGNTEILNLDESFSNKFREQSIYQNGDDVEAVNALSDEELAEFFNDDTSLIIYYTPLGMEVGFNYQASGSSGWVSATFNDYEQYKSSF